MSYSIMEALFEGEIIPWERRTVHTKEHKALMEKYQREKQQFIETISSEDGKTFKHLEEMYMQVAFDEEVQIYSHGFTLGALLMMEVLEKKESIINA